MELLQYSPQTEHVHAAPLLCSPPWINKYYVMDLAPGRSFIEWAVQHERTVWSAENSGPLVDPPSTGDSKYPVLYDGPGEYIHT